MVFENVVFTNETSYLLSIEKSINFDNYWSNISVFVSLAPRPMNALFQYHAWSQRAYGIGWRHRIESGGASWRRRPVEIGICILDLPFGRPRLQSHELPIDWLTCLKLYEWFSSNQFTDDSNGLFSVPSQEFQ